ncbi:hypothetical protein K2173_011452 [Erythroxylum novogranatense]|uniref:Uncharacterized protein n=1 Tax=Erythroxylum novogranatense TaxID=1862640 RepID=A0AAV8TEA1_9ROSI|nr:hypothetical protein K2173_011452 [Erythroxylum novogranatense]
MVEVEKAYKPFEGLPIGLGLMGYMGNKNTYDPWMVVSVSDDYDTTGGGGTLQRMSDLLYQLEDEVLIEFEKFKSHVVSCGSKA